MIPQRVKISGFLSYKDEQEIRFDSSPLWMLSGTNGSGKSTVFDAVTFALFGHHRGGSQSAAELINKESNTLSVEFDFTVEKQLYRIKRTVRRRTSGVASTQQAMKFMGGTQTLPLTPSPQRRGGTRVTPFPRREGGWGVRFFRLLGSHTRYHVQSQVRCLDQGQDRPRLRNLHLVGAAASGQVRKAPRQHPGGPRGCACPHR